MRDIGELISSSEQDFAFGSVIRCSTTGWDRAKRRFSGESKHVIPAFRKDSEAIHVVRACLRRFLRPLPERLKLVVLLSNDRNYITNLSREIAALYPEDFRSVNPVACFAGGRYWVHVAHPSPLNGWFNAFVSGSPDGGQGLKREQARAAVAAALAPRSDDISARS